jgi:hypothetical protein
MCHLWIICKLACMAQLRLVLSLHSGNVTDTAMDQHDKHRVDMLTCPVCDYRASKSSVNARKALQEHIRRTAANDPLHRIWKEVYYAQYFPWGGSCAKAQQHAPCASDIVRVIKRVYGDQWGAKCELAFGSGAGMTV